MTTKRLFAVEVFDNTCNVLGHESGIYGKGDYSWMTDTLNGGNGEYTMTEEEALEVKADFERVIKEKNLEWASVEIDPIDVPVAETMQDIADYYNDADCLNVAELERMIEDAGWVSDCGEEWGVCHNDSEKVIINDNGEAVVVDNNPEKTYDVQFDDDSDSNSKGWHESLDYCMNYIKQYNGTNESYFEDYKGGTVSIVCNETGETVYSENVKHVLEDVELEKGSYNRGDYLSWTLDGVEQDCTGEFYVDKNGYLHHTAIAPNGDEVEIIIKY